MCLEFALQGPQISKFLRQNPLELETPNTEVPFRAAHGVRPELPRKLGADQAPGRRFGFGAFRQKEPPDLRPPLFGRSIALLFWLVDTGIDDSCSKRLEQAPKLL